MQQSISKHYGLQAFYMIQYKHPCTVWTSRTRFGNLININILIMMILGFCHHNRVHTAHYKLGQNSNLLNCYVPCIYIACFH